MPSLPSFPFHSEMLLITRKEKHSLENELLAAKGLATNARHESRIDAMAAEARELRDKYVWH